MSQKDESINSTIAAESRTPQAETKAPKERKQKSKAGKDVSDPIKDQSHEQKTGTVAINANEDQESLTKDDVTSKSGQVTKPGKDECDLINDDKSHEQKTEQVAVEANEDKESPAEVVEDSDMLKLKTYPKRKNQTQEQL